MGSKNKDSNTKKGKRPANTSPAAIDESGKGNRTEKNIINDSRFAALHSDPRFREPPQKKSKVTIDSRFNRMFTDKNFTSSKAPTDIRGKPRNKSSSNNPLNHYYHIQEEEQADGEKQKRQKEKSKPITSPLIKKINANLGKSDEEEEEEESDSDSGTSEEEIEDLKLKKVVVASSESEDDEELERDDSLASTEDEDSDSDDESDEVSSEEEDTFMQKEDVPEIDKETKRLAAVNMDWGRVKAVDLYVLLNSLLPKGGQIISVAVYPSDFGLNRMEEEAVNGPIGLFDDENEKDEDSDDEDDDDDEIDNKKLRAYEMSRLRYYYAVVECDSIATADYLYKTCDGVEFERTSNKLDLRFIPDSMEFKHQPRDIATEAPADYEGLDFHTRALQHSNIELTWDEDEPQRIRTLKRQFNDEQLADLELKEFLASDESESDASEEGDDTEDKSAKRKKKQDAYRALLQSGEGSDGNNEDDDQDMEVTFNTGLEDLSKRILEKKDKQSETVWEAYLRKKKEKKKSRKGNSKDSSEDESSDSDQEPIEESEDFFIDEASAKEDKSTRKRKQSLEASEEAEASRAELELLLADDKAGDANLKGYNMKPKRSKGKKGKEIPVEDKLPSIDYEDPRFSSLFKSPLFALDPTDPQFKRSAAYARQLAQKQHKAEEGIVKEKQQPGIAAPLQPSRTLEAVTSEKLQSDDLPLRKEKHELSSLVKSIKMKSQQLSLPSQGKVVGKNEKSRASAKKIDEERGIEENEKSRARAKKDGKRRK
ncbi:pre-rRNA-processing protein ESF1 isoform X1 [Lycium barbarum]|uniref:pre-rRNA-processing protein ESF1 isoform X1 n=1 Tax=Lycium barbarum TaxID=112863 RepID=UPI00293F6DBE|nr:pre-rRNA-processing protein ESF1 isoform X1 [Lycium barbarum]